MSLPAPPTRERERERREHQLHALTSAIPHRSGEYHKLWTQQQQDAKESGGQAEGGDGVFAEKLSEEK